MSAATSSGADSSGHGAARGQNVARYFKGEKGIGRERIVLHKTGAGERAVQLVSPGADASAQPHPP